MPAPDLRGRRWLPAAGVAGLVALTILDVVLIRLAFEHVDAPAPTSSESATSAQPSEESAPEPTATATEEAAATALPSGPLLLGLAPDGTALLAARGGCTGGADPAVAVAPPGADSFRTVPVPRDLASVLAVRSNGRDDLVVVGADGECQVSAYTGAAARPTWSPGPAQDEWYLDVTQEPPAVHAPGGPVEVPCAPVALSTLDAVRLLCDGGGLVGTGDGGETWAALGRLEDAMAMAFEGPGRGLALAERDNCPVAVLATENGGAGWETISCLEGDTGRAVALRGEAVVAVVDDTLWRSADAGETWERPVG